MNRFTIQYHCEPIYAVGISNQLIYDGYDAPESWDFYKSHRGEDYYSFDCSNPLPAADIISDKGGVPTVLYCGQEINISSIKNYHGILMLLVAEHSNSCYPCNNIGSTVGYLTSISTVAVPYVKATIRYAALDECSTDVATVVSKETAIADAKAAGNDSLVIKLLDCSGIFKRAFDLVYLGQDASQLIEYIETQTGELAALNNLKAANSSNSI